MLTLRFHPPLKIASIVDEETVEEWSRVGLRCALVVTAPQRLVKRLNVARHDCRIETELGGSEDHLSGTEVAAQRITALSQEASAVSRISVRPQVGDELVATETAGVPRKQR